VLKRRMSIGWAGAGWLIRSEAGEREGIGEVSGTGVSKIAEERSAGEGARDI